MKKKREDKKRKKETKVPIIDENSASPCLPKKKLWPKVFPLSSNEETLLKKTCTKCCIHTRHTLRSHRSIHEHSPLFPSEPFLVKERKKGRKKERKNGEKKGKKEND